MIPRHEGGYTQYTAGIKLRMHEGGAAEGQNRYHCETNRKYN